MKGKTKAAIKTLDLMSFEEAIGYLEGACGNITNSNYY